MSMLMAPFVAPFVEVDVEASMSSIGTGIGTGIASTDVGAGIGTTSGTGTEHSKLFHIMDTKESNLASSASYLKAFGSIIIAKINKAYKSTQNFILASYLAEPPREVPATPHRLRG